MKNKHAYLIMAHNQFELLEHLIQQLDDERNDLYIHIDKKIKNFDFDKFKHLPIKSDIYFVPRIDTKWGGYSLIQCELTLLKEAVKRSYRYYHLLSGMDFPLKTQDDIHAFFKKYSGMEFIHFLEVRKKETKKFVSRISRYHLFQDYSPKNNAKLFKIGIFITDKSFLVLQRLMRINRLKNKDITVKFGSQWFSITDNFAKYVVAHEKWIKDHFFHSLCADELFLQTLIYRSHFKNKLGGHYFKGNHLSNMRKIEWSSTTASAHPKVWETVDYDSLVNTEHLFARKFDLTVDSEIVEQLCNYLENKND